MPIINADVKGLEVAVAADLSQDAILIDEIIGYTDGRYANDVHENNRISFNLGEGKPGRNLAKRFKFRLIYGGSAYSYANDPEFTHVSTSEKFWQKVIDQYYDKYRGIADWHRQLMQTARNTGRLSIPSGRFFPIVPKQTAWGLKWPDTVIKNYPVQGMGADLVMLARLQAYKLFKELGIEGKFISTIHDSIVMDVPTHNVLPASTILNKAIEDVPTLCERVFNYKLKVPMTAEVSYGPNKSEMEQVVLDNQLK